MCAHSSGPVDPHRAHQPSAHTNAWNSASPRTHGSHAFLAGAVLAVEPRRRRAPAQRLERLAHRSADDAAAELRDRLFRRDVVVLAIEADVLGVRSLAPLLLGALHHLEPRALVREP